MYFAEWLVQKTRVAATTCRSCEHVYFSTEGSTTHVAATSVANTDFVYALIRVFTRETQVAAIATNGATLKVYHIASSVTDMVVGDFLWQPCVKDTDQVF